MALLPIQVLQELNLRNNSITDDGAREIACYLKTNQVGVMGLLLIIFLKEKNLPVVEFIEIEFVGQQNR